MPRGRNEEESQKSHILKTLYFMKNNSDLAGLPGDQSNFVSSAYSRLKETAADDWEVDIHSFEIPVKNEELKYHNPTLLIGGTIKGERAKIMWSSLHVCLTFTSDWDNLPNSYRDVPSEQCLNVPSCCLGAYRNQKRIVRSFHFDYQPEKRPKSHIQYGGKIIENGYNRTCHYCLEHFLEHPRLHYPPMDLVLLVDLFIREFHTPLSKWTQEPDWKGLVIISQHLYWGYWGELLDQATKSHTLHEWMYGGK
jgi:hypothetical protein